MAKNLKGKFAAIIVVLVIFCYGIIGIPHGLSGTALKDALKERIHLGLDLKGGTRLVLKVHVEDAVNSTTDRDVEHISDDLSKISVNGAQVKKPDPVNHPGVITISGVPANKLSDARGALNTNDYTNYDISSNAAGALTLALKPGALRDIQTHALQQSIETIGDRVNALGVGETTVQQYGLGDNEIVVELPGVSDPDEVEKIINTTAKLAVYPVVPGQGPWGSDQEALQALGGTVPPDQMLVHGSCTSNTSDQVCLLYRQSVVEGTDSRDAQPSTDQNGRPNMTFTLTTDAGQRFYKFTSAHLENGPAPEQIAIVMGNQVKEVAGIEGPISDRGEIHGSFSHDEVAALSLMLRTGALPAALDTLDTFTVGPSLGAESIHQGVKAAVAGTLAVMIFLLFYYKGAGINAVLALTLNLIILLGFFGLMPVIGLPAPVLTLPGIAGVILTIGMGVDSNVLIFERIREELRTGKTAAAAVDKGFAMTGALVTIVDTHVTTIVAAGILFLFGTGPVKGFAVTLTFGLLANLFTSVFVSRVIFDAVLGRKGRSAELSI
jgi:preprotein translocase subunit SecD